MLLGPAGDYVAVLRPSDRLAARRRLNDCAATSRQRPMRQSSLATRIRSIPTAAASRPGSSRISAMTCSCARTASVAPSFSRSAACKAWPLPAAADLDEGIYASGAGGDPVLGPRSAALPRHSGACRRRPGGDAQGARALSGRRHAARRGGGLRRAARRRWPARRSKARIRTAFCACAILCRTRRHWFPSSSRRAIARTCWKPASTASTMRPATATKRSSSSTTTAAEPETKAYFAALAQRSDVRIVARARRRSTIRG